MPLSRPRPGVLPPVLAQDAVESSNTVKKKEGDPSIRSTGDDSEKLRPSLVAALALSPDGTAAILRPIAAQMT
jgi:hypothetical protein